MRRHYLLLLFLLTIAANCFAQAPVINNIQPLNAGPNQKIVITGNGFNSTTTQNLVWFDHTKGTVTAATNYSLEVLVPAQARFSNVEVINLANGLSGKSQLKFLPSYGGAQFNVANTKLAKVDSATLEYFDVASTDLDLDGDVDMVTSRGGPTSTAAITDLFVFQNTSTGIGNIKFTRSSLTTGAPTANVACGDLNGDGKPEIIATRGGNTRNEIFVYKNTNLTAGTMSFAPKVTLLLDVGQAAFRVSIRDLDGDGRPELIVNNAFNDNNSATDNQIYVFPNSSSGGTISFLSPIKLNVTGANTTYGLEVQDLDGDTKPDIIVNQYQDSVVFVFRNSSTGNLSFDPVLQLHSKGKFNNITSSDLDKDGLLDLIATSTLQDNIWIWINKSTPGNISFPSASTFTLASSKQPWGVDVSDIDGDGDADIIVANKNGIGTQFDPTDVKLNIFRQDGPLTFTRLDVATANPSRNLRVGDYDGDGKQDIAYTSFPAAGLTFRLDVIRNRNCWSPVITGPSNKICLGQTIPLQVQPALGVTYDWKIGGTSQGVNASSLNATVAGNFTMTLTGTADVGCINTSPTYTLVADNTNAFPTDPVISNNVPCLGQALNLSTGAVASATYKWAGPNSFSSTAQNPTVPVVSNQSAGIYTLQVTLNTGCQSNVVQKQLDVASVPVLPVTSTPSATGCVGANITLSVSGSGYTYKWNKGGVAISPAATSATLALNSLTAAMEGDYSVVVTSIANSCSQETLKTSVKVFAPPTANFSMSTPQCKGDTIRFTDGSTGDNRGTLTYSWNFGDASASTFLKNAKHVYTNAGPYNPSVTVGYVETNGTCTTNAPQSLTVNAPVVPVLQASVNPMCLGKQTTLSITGSYVYDSITWFSISGVNKYQVTSVDLKVTDVNQFRYYKLRTKDQNSCYALDSIEIDSIPRITPIPFKISASKTSIKPGETVQLNAPTGADSYLWNYGKTLSDSTIANPIATPKGTTQYLLIAKKAGYCDATDSLTILLDTGGAIINPPVLFTPNSDGKNDTWDIPEAVSYPEWTMTIFDSHGSQIFQKKGYPSGIGSGWDGGSAPEGVYYYVFSNANGKPNTGSVLLVRQKP